MGPEQTGGPASVGGAAGVPPGTHLSLFVSPHSAARQLTTCCSPSGVHPRKAFNCHSENNAHFNFR